MRYLCVPAAAEVMLTVWAWLWFTSDLQLVLLDTRNDDVTISTLVVVVVFSAVVVMFVVISVVVARGVLFVVVTCVGVVSGFVVLSGTNGVVLFSCCCNSVPRVSQCIMRTVLNIYITNTISYIWCLIHKVEWSKMKV